MPFYTIYDCIAFDSLVARNPANDCHIMIISKFFQKYTRMRGFKAFFVSSASITQEAQKPALLAESRGRRTR